MTTPKNTAANPNNTALTSQDPTTYLPDPTDSAFFRAGSPGFAPLPDDEPKLNAPAFLTESRFTREREQDEADALASLDETILRPMALHFAAGAEPSQAQPQPAAAGSPESPLAEGPAAPNQQPQTPRQPRSWRWVAVAAAFVVAGAVGVKAYGSRQSNVGLLGMQTPTEKVAAQIEGKVTHQDGSQPEESEPTSPLSSTSVTDSYASEEASPTWQDDGYGTESDGAITTDDLYEWFWSTPDDSPSTGYPSYVSPYGSGETGYEYDPYDDWLTYDRDEGSVSFTYDGNSVTYYYDDDRLTFELDDLGQHFDSLDDWYCYDPYESPSHRHTRSW